MKIYNIASTALPQVNSPSFRFIKNEADMSVEILIYDIIGTDPWDGKGFTAKNFAEALAGVDKSSELTIRVNSRGGDVDEGIAIYNRLKEWPSKTVAIIDGSASSIASVLIQGAKEIRMPKSAEIFIHEAWGFSMGNAADMIESSNRLNQASDRIAAIYAERTGKSKDTMRSYMKAGTVFNGEQAKEVGLADVVTDSKPLYNLSPEDISRFRCVPESGSKQTVAAPNAPAINTKDKMNREQMIALLAERGVTVAKDATDEQLFALLKAELNKKPETKPATPDNSELLNGLKTLQAAYDRERKDRITREVDKLVLDEKITQPMHAEVLALAIQNESTLDTWRKLPPRPPGVEPLAPLDVDAKASNKDVVAQLNRFNEPVRGWQRGINVAMDVIRNASVQRAEFIQKFAARIQGIWNTNTIDATLKQDVILQTIIVDFVRVLLPLRAFSTVFANVPLAGNKTVQVPFYDLDATASTAFVAATGYTFGNTTNDNRAIIVGLGATNGGRYYQGMSFTSEELNFQPYFNVVQLAKLKAEKLASDIVADVLSVVTLANFGAAAITKQAALFDSNDIAGLKESCKTWPAMGRSLMLDSAYDASLLKDDSIKSAMHYGGAEAIREGKIPKLFGFDYYENPNIPANAQNLVGFAVFQSAILFASAPCPPIEEVRRAGVSYQLVVDPQTGIAFEYRAFGNGQMDTAYQNIECSYGWAKGNANALKRIVSA